MRAFGGLAALFVQLVVKYTSYPRCHGSAAPLWQKGALLGRRCSLLRDAEPRRWRAVERQRGAACLVVWIEGSHVLGQASASDGGRAG